MDPTPAVPWQIWIDTGGTFTDCIARDPRGRLHRAKVLSSSALRASVEKALAHDALRIREEWKGPQGLVDGFAVRLLGLRHPPARVTSYDQKTRTVYLDRPLPDLPPVGTTVELASPEEAPILAAKLVTQTPFGGRLPPLAMRLATTRGTNALLERRGGRVALFITRGFGDLLRIGTQQRPDLFALDVRTREPLYQVVVEVDERLAADGSVLQAMDATELAPVASQLAADGIDAAAVALMHAYRNPAHERAVAEALRCAGFRHVSLSHELAPLIKLLPRAETAVVDATLSPVIRDYLQRVGAALHGGRLHVTTSAGGLVRPEEFRAKDSLLSGPAGGVAGAAYSGRRSGFGRVIAFDMGGTSTDVARWDGDFEYVWEHEVGGGRIFSPALAIETVAAGGGSVCAFDGEGLRVGPESAGAVPGPAAYGAGGPLTLTDCNLLLGRISHHHFPIPVDSGLSADAADALLREVRERTGEETSREALLAGLIEIADERMADAIRTISLRRGYDPAGYALVAFGGAGGQHACGVAERLGIATVVVPPDAGLLSALGIGHAPLERFAERQVLRPLAEVSADVGAWFTELGNQALEAVAREGVERGSISVRRRIASLRYAGQESSLEVEWAPGGDLRRGFEERYAAVYGHRPADRPIELESMRAVASTPPAEISTAGRPERFPAPTNGSRRVWVRGGWRKVPCYTRENLKHGASFTGPAVVTEAHAATYVAEGWDAEVDGAGALVLERGGPIRLVEDVEEARTPEAVRLELFVNRFRALVGEMGEMLRRTALSTNVKERLDFSCALLDAQGELVVNAPHIPVHLGALGLCVRSVAAALPMQPGDVVVTNHPAFGGSHLPDVTVITPVHDAAGALLGYVASRAHHAEIGGTRPGSMPPDARTLAEEGVVIPPTYLVRGGEARWDELRALLTGAPHPTRAVEENLADLAAAVAANHRGATLLAELAHEHGAAAVSGYMDALKQRAESGVREALHALGDGVYQAEERLDDGSVLRARVEVNGDGAVIDFSGTSGVHAGNLNATPAVVRSVVLYVLRLMMREPLPLNEGLLRAVDVRIPAGMLSPEWPEDASQAPAVVGGNTEVSQRLTDTLLKALDLVACSQGTMNNTLWGTDRFGYYETVCGGAGAGPRWHGADAVHTHMTNTRITDPEVVEHRYPVRIDRFAVREGSGGNGRFRGGDGAVRETVFLEPMSLSILAQHRAEGPYGVDGGHPGAPGTQRLVRASGEVVQLRGVDGCEVAPGDRLVLETPGGGGWGAA
ncbi:MAG TPA: hydantoinase B/oxoprolinase family protein [Longimicrobium sp.]|nr:hydantoinase B/oxoprolinase family protein [Longimicrobium sp.]